LEDARAGLDPRNPADRREIAAINAQIDQLRQQIVILQQRGQALGCAF